MLNITSINPTGLFSYGLSQTINLTNKGLVCLVGINEDTGGDSNGAGKTSVFNALCEVLYGKNPTGVSGAGAVNHVWNKGYAGRVEFNSWEKIPCRVTYCRGWKQSSPYLSDNNNGIDYVGTDLYFDKFVDNAWVDFRGASKKETRQRILDSLGMSYDRFLSVSYMSYRVGNLFLRGTNKDRMDILAGIAGIDDWDKVLVSCREFKKQYKTQIDQLMSQLAFEQGVLSQLKTQLTDLNSKNLENLIEDYTTNLVSYQTEEAKCVKQYERVLAQKAQYTVVEQVDPEMQTLEKSIQVLAAKQLEADSDLKMLRNECDISKNEYHRALGQLSSFQQAKGSVVDLTKCPTCDSLLTKVVKNKINKQLKKLNKTVNQLKDEYASLEVKVAERLQVLKEDRDQELNTFNIQLAQKREDQASQLRDQQAKTAELDGHLVQLNQQLGMLRQEISKLQTMLGTTKQELARKVELSQGIVTKQAQVKEIEKQSDSLSKVIVSYDWFISNIPYIKLHKLSQSMALISDSTNRYLAAIGDSTRIIISSFSEKKSAKTVSDIKDLLKSEIQIEIVDGTKNIDPRLYSDGEIGKISNVVIRALRNVALQYGKGCNILLLDEMFTFIDSLNSQKLAQSFSDSARVGTVVVTDNSGKARDLLNFDSVWIAKKVNGLTTLEV